MALPTDFNPSGPRKTRFGVKLAINTNNPDFPVVVERTSDDGAGSPATSAAIELASLSPRTQIFTDILPPDNTNRHYRTFHRKNAYDDGTPTDWICAKPALLSSVFPELGDQEGARRGAAGLNQTLPVVKTLRIPHAELVPNNDTTLFSFGSNWLHPNSTSFSTYIGSVVLAKGITVTQLAAHMFIQSTASTGEARFNRTLDDGTGVTVATVTTVSTGWNTVTSSSFSETIGENAYSIIVDLHSDNSVQDTRFAYVEFEYTMPTYDSVV